MEYPKGKIAAAALVLRSWDLSIKSLYEDFDLFPQSLFSNLSIEEHFNVKDLLLGSRLQEEDIDLSSSNG